MEDVSLSLARTHLAATPSAEEASTNSTSTTHSGGSVDEDFSPLAALVDALPDVFVLEILEKRWGCTKLNAVDP